MSETLSRSDKFAALFLIVVLGLRKEAGANGGLRDP